MQSSTKRTVVVTGSDKGIGFFIVEKLLAGETPYEVITTSRNEKLGQEAYNKLKEKYPSTASTFLYHQLDITDSKSVETFATWLKDTSGKLDVLINNAGIMLPHPTDEQKHQVISTNYFGVVNSTEKLLPLLAEDGKILIVSSTLGILSLQGPLIKATLEREDLTEEELNRTAHNILEGIKDYPKDILDPTYNASKAFINTYIRKFLPSKLKKTQHYFAVCPGLCATDLTARFNDFEIYPKSIEITAEEGADTPVYLTNLPFEKSAELNGLFIARRQPQPY